MVIWEKYYCIYVVFMCKPTLCIRKRKPKENLLFLRKMRIENWTQNSLGKVSLSLLFLQKKGQRYSVSIDPLEHLWKTYVILLLQTFGNHIFRNKIYSNEDRIFTYDINSSLFSWYLWRYLKVALDSGRCFHSAVCPKQKSHKMLTKFESNSRQNKPSKQNQLKWFQIPWDLFKRLNMSYT